MCAADIKAVNQAIRQPANQPDWRPAMHAKNIVCCTFPQQQADSSFRCGFHLSTHFPFIALYVPLFDWTISQMGCFCLVLRFSGYQKTFCIETLKTSKPLFQRFRVVNKCNSKFLFYVYSISYSNRISESIRRLTLTKSNFYLVTPLKLVKTWVFVFASKQVFIWTSQSFNSSSYEKEFSSIYTPTHTYVYIYMTYFTCLICFVLIAECTMYGWKVE